MRARDEEISSEDGDAIVKRIKLPKHEDDINFGTIAYLTLTPKQREKVSLRTLEFLPKDLQIHVAKLDAGGLLKLAQTSRFFAELARNDNVWKDLFERDFPHDYKYCKGVLPFFVITEDHPFYVQGMLDYNYIPSPKVEQLNPFEPIDRVIGVVRDPGWKRFYLHTRLEYFEQFGVDTFADSYRSFNLYVKQNKPQIVAQYCYLFITVMAYVLKGGGNFQFEKFTPNDPLRIVTEYVQSPDYKNVMTWMIPYIYCSFVTNDSYVDNDFVYLTGVVMLPEPNDYDFIVPKTKYDAWEGYVSLKHETLFSEDDYLTLRTFLFSKMERPNAFIGFRGIEKDRDKQFELINSVLLVWKMISAAYNNMNSLYAHHMFGYSIFVGHMVHESVSTQLQVRELINENPTAYLAYENEEEIFDTPRMNALLSRIVNPIYRLTNNEIETNLHKLIKPHCFSPRFGPKSKNAGKIEYVLTCIGCGVAQATHQCGRCKGAKYCSPKCQKNHWHKGGHKHACQKE